MRAFRHPLVILSIFILLLNDHFLKAAAPSWLTGKLSDFAGLFFFPFLVGVAVQAAGGFLRSSRASTVAKGGLASPEDSRRCLLAGMIFTALVFAAIKTIPAVNTFAASLLSAVFGNPVPIALDPTDLLALVMLAPAWLLWKRIQADRPAQAPGRLAYAALGLGALASLATQPIEPAPSIQRLIVSADTIYARDPHPWNGSDKGAYTSRDQGQSWEWTGQVPEQIQQELSRPPALPMTLCEQSAPQTCYRIDGRPRVEVSMDGGNSWQAAWEIPAGRERYIQRAACESSYLFPNCFKTADLRAFDMVFAPGSDGSKLIVAMGNEGLLIHTAGAGWQRVKMLISNSSSFPAPTAFYAASFDQALEITRPEWMLGLGIAFLAYLVTSVLAWIYTAFHISPEGKNSLGWVFSPTRLLAALALVLLTGWLIYILALLSSNTPLMFDLLGVVVVVLILVTILVLSIVIWNRAGTLVPHPGKYKRLMGCAFLVGLLSLAVVLAGFILWAFGVIASYENTLSLVTAVIAFVLLSGNIWILRTIRRVMM